MTRSDGPPDPLAISVQGLRKAYGATTVLDGIDFAVRRGSVFALLGPNGSGKTTTLSLVAGMQPPTAGDLRWKNESLVGRRPFEIAMLGIVKTFQNPQLFPELTVLDHMRIACHLGLKRALGWGRLKTLVWPAAGREVAEEAEAKMLDMLRLCRLVDVRDETAASLSYGAEKMLGVAMAMMCDPELLLLDEPASGLGQDEITNLEAVLRDLRQHGVTLCIIDHKVSFLGRLADRSIALAHGAVIAQGPTPDVLADEAVITAYLGRKHA